MSDRLTQVRRAFVEAHNAGNEKDAMRLAEEIVRLQMDNDEPEIFDTFDGPPVTPPGKTELPPQIKDAITRAKSGQAFKGPTGKHPTSLAGPVPVSQAEGISGHAAQGGTFGFADEISAAADSVLGTAPYADALAIRRDRLKKYADENPVTSTVAEIGGAIPTALLPMGAVGRAAQGKSLLARIMAGGAIGAGQGSVYGFGSGEGDANNRAKQAATGAALGGGVAALAPIGATAARKMASKVTRRGAEKAAIKSAPSTASLKKQAQEAYGKARSAGVDLAPQHFSGLVSKLQTRLGQEGLDPTLHPKASAIMQRFDSLARQNASLPEATTLRRLASTVAGSTDADERRIGSMIVEELDDYVAKLGPDDVLSGDPAIMADNLIDGRDLWRRAKGSEMIDDVFTKADLQASGVENGLRVQFRQILTNPKMRRMLSKDEIDAMERVVKGTATSNVYRKLARFGFGSGAQHNVLSGMAGVALGGSAGAEIGGTAGAAIGAGLMPAIGLMGSRGAERVATKNSILARALLANGGLPAANTNTQIPETVQRLLQRNTPITSQLNEALYQYR